MGGTLTFSPSDGVDFADPETLPCGRSGGTSLKAFQREGKRVLVIQELVVLSGSAVGKPSYADLTSRLH